MARRVTRHSKYILNEHFLSNKASLKPGMILKFKYNKKTSFDKYPLILYLYRDRAANLIHGLNLNYLLEKEVKFLFDEISQRASVGLLDGNDPLNKLGVSYTYVKFKNVGEVARAERKQIYKYVIADFEQKRKKDIYRTYAWNLINNMKVVEYRF